jgi:hypothetical protein
VSVTTNIRCRIHIFRYVEYFQADRIVKLALWFANSRAGGIEDWPAEVCRRLGVLPVGTPYAIDSTGQAFPYERPRPSKSRGGPKRHARLIPVPKATMPGTTECQTRLTAALEAILDRDELTSGDAWIAVGPASESRQKKYQVRFDRFPHVWVPYVIDGSEMKPSDQPFVTPTLREFVAVAAAVISQDPFCRRLSKCRWSECEKYFLVPIRRAGRRSATCSESCAAARGDPTNAERQRRHRERRSRERGR